MATAAPPWMRAVAKVDFLGSVPEHRPELGPCHPRSGSHRGGYPTMTVGGRRVTIARWMCEQTYGPLPPGYVPDHLCHDPDYCPGGVDCPHRRCVNLQHLAVVPEADNIRRGASPNGINSRKRACKRNHALSGDNLYKHPQRGTRHCRRCQTIRFAAWHRQRAAGPGQLPLAI